MQIYTIDSVALHGAQRIYAPQGNNAYAYASVYTFYGNEKAKRSCTSWRKWTEHAKISLLQQPDCVCTC